MNILACVCGRNYTQQCKCLTYYTFVCVCVFFMCGAGIINILCVLICIIVTQNRKSTLMYVYAAHSKLLSVSYAYTNLLNISADIVKMPFFYCVKHLNYFLNPRYVLAFLLFLLRWRYIWRNQNFGELCGILLFANKTNFQH